MESQKIYGGLEGGGTKFVCMVGRGPQDIIEEIRIPTTTPEETVRQSIAFFARHAKKVGLSALGIASFGPLDLDESSPTYGHITATPKPGWTGADMLGRFRQAFDIPLAFELDVNAAAFGEYYWVPENRCLDSLVYFTIGTGIGAGVIVNGQLVHGLVHPEAGHVRIPHDWQADPYPGCCPFHGDCFEGLAGGPAITERWGIPAETIPDDHPAWALEAGYVALAMCNVILTLSPQRIVLGGGVMERRQLFPAIRQKVRGILNNYISSPVITGTMEKYILSPALDKRSGVLGAIAMAKVLTEGERA